MTTSPDTLRGTTQRLSALRKTIARRMVSSMQTSAQLTTVTEVDVTDVSELRRSLKEPVAAAYDGLKLTLLPFVCVAATEALRMHPVINASIDEDAGTATYHDQEHLAIAVQTDKGLVAPVVPDAGAMGVVELGSAIADVSGRSRAGRATAADYDGATFTVTNTGSRGALFDTPIVNQPNVAILGVGAVVPRPVATTTSEGYAISVREMMYLALSYDHRLVDGADAAAYLGEVKRLLTECDFKVDIPAAASTTVDGQA